MTWVDLCHCFLVTFVFSCNRFSNVLVELIAHFTRDVGTGWPMNSLWLHRGTFGSNGQTTPLFNWWWSLSFRLSPFRLKVVVDEPPLFPSISFLSSHSVNCFCSFHFAYLFSLWLTLTLYLSPATVDLFTRSTCLSVHKPFPLATISTTSHSSLFSPASI